MEIDYNKVERLIAYVFRTATQGDAESILAAIDTFCYTQEWCMNVGDVKGQFVTEAILCHKPKDDPGAHYYTIEFDSILACVIEKMLRFAGLDHKVTVLKGNLQENITALKEKYNVQTIDFLFIDHIKSSYLSDFQLAESYGLFHKGTVIAADNIINPGAPDYLSHMQAHNKFESNLIDTEYEYTKGQEKDAVLISICIE
ncbi:hypothetical protein DSO57_1022900 [Entomophthora muscae]|uniref:Uncharacterized protein n=1 Tax=Entomophthora muscae TaxID=34485 RepID=A0ACC2U2F5_9FUNG|nr:hypothetical protein DSO57_1022900 [Entomophthora muscae]